MRWIVDRCSAAWRKGLQVVYRIGVVLYRYEYFRLSDFLIRVHLYGTGQADLVRTRNTNFCPNQSDYGAFERSFRAFLDERWRNWTAGRIDLPIFLKESEPTPDLARLKDLRVLVITPRYRNSSALYLENDFIDHYYRSLINIGVDAHIFYADGICYPAIFRLDPLKALSDLAQLRQTVAQIRPEVILFDGNFVGAEGSLSASYLAEIKDSFGPKLVAFVIDAWGNLGIDAVNYWAPVSDLVVHTAPGGDAERKNIFQKKLWCSAVPNNERIFFPQADRSTDISFFGSYGTYLRAFWFGRVKMTVRRLGLRGDIHTSSLTKDGPAMPEYAAIMRASRMVMNCSSRSQAIRIMTHRVWQAIRSGVVLLEEENEATRTSFIPFIHYVPFENAVQLDHMVEFFVKNPDCADRIGQAAAEFSARHYSAAQIWARLFMRI